jgi:hypothetical protein
MGLQRRIGELELSIGAEQQDRDALQWRMLLSAANVQNNIIIS